MKPSIYTVTRGRDFLARRFKVRRLTAHFVRLHPEIPSLLPPRPRHLLRPLLIHLASKSIKINLSSPLIDVNIAQLDTQIPLAVEQLVANEERNHDGSREVCLEEIHGIGGTADREERDVELGDEAEDVERETDPGPDCAEHGSEREVVGRAAVHGPRLAEADVGVADAAPGEEVGETGDGQKPSEDGAAVFGFVDVGEAAEKEGHDEHDVGTTFGVNAGTDCGTHATCAESLDGTGCGEGAGVCDGEDGEGDDCVENGWESFDASQLEGEHERRVAGVTSRGLGEVVVIRGDDQAQEEERDHVKEGDAPEDLLGCFRDRLARVGGFCCCETDELSSSEGEGGRDEDGTESLEAITERTWLVPVVSTNVASGIGRNSTAVDDNTEDDEADNGSDLDDAENEFDLAVASHAEDVDNTNTDQEDSDPDSNVDGRSASILGVCPEGDCDTSSGQLERQDDQPVHGIVPAHGKAPSGVNEADRVVIERTSDGI